MVVIANEHVRNREPVDNLQFKLIGLLLLVAGAVQLNDSLDQGTKQTIRNVITGVYLVAVSVMAYREMKRWKAEDEQRQRAEQTRTQQPRRM